MTDTNKTETTTHRVDSHFNGPFGYGAIVPLRLDHRVRRLDSLPDALRSANALPVVVSEFAFVADTLPIVFVPSGSAEAPVFIPSALTGLAAGENLVAADGQWDQAVYAPGYLRRFPFLLAQVDGDSERMVACVDAEFLGGADALPLADSTGQALPEWTAMQEFLSQYQADLDSTLAWSEQLHELGVLEPFAFEGMLGGSDADGEVHADGFFRVNEDALNALSDQDLARLQRDGSLALVQCHLLSLRRFAELLQRRAQQQGAGQVH